MKRSQSHRELTVQHIGLVLTVRLETAPLPIYKKKKRAPLPFPEDGKKRLRYGAENEKHVIATVLGNLMPSLLPRCFAYQEVAAVFLTVGNEEKFMEVSTDGLLMCFGGENCSERKSTENHYSIPL